MFSGSKGQESFIMETGPEEQDNLSVEIYKPVVYNILKIIGTETTNEEL